MRAWLLLGALTLGCEPEAAPRLTNRPAGRGPGNDVAQTAAEPDDEAARSTRRRRERGGEPSEPSQQQQQPGEAPGEAPPGLEPPPRDLPAELARAFGTPTRCISQATRDRVVEGTLRMTVLVTVSPTGVVTRAYVSGAQLGADDRECLTEHAERLRLRGPIEGAPRSIATVVEYTVASTPAVAVEETPRVDPIEGNVAPDRTLPAAGTANERPPGFVPPSRTLPARVD